VSVIRKIRERLDVRLDELDAKAEAFEAQFESTGEQIAQRLEEGKRRLAESAERVEDAAVKSAGIAGHGARDLKTAFEHLRVQLALGRAETREALEDQDRKIRHALADIASRLERAEDQFEEDVAMESAAFVRMANRLRAEFEAAEVQFALFRADRRAEAHDAAKAMRGRVRQLRSEIQEAGSEAAERVQAFETEFAAGLQRIRKAFAKARDED